MISHSLVLSVGLIVGILVATDHVSVAEDKVSSEEERMSELGILGHARGCPDNQDFCFQMCEEDGSKGGHCFVKKGEGDKCKCDAIVAEVKPATGGVAAGGKSSNFSTSFNSSVGGKTYWNKSSSWSSADGKTVAGGKPPITTRMPSAITTKVPSAKAPPTGAPKVTPKG